MDERFEQMEAERLASYRAGRAKEEELRTAPLQMVVLLEQLNKGVQAISEGLNRMVDVLETRKK